MDEIMDLGYPLPSNPNAPEPGDPMRSSSRERACFDDPDA